MFVGVIIGELLVNKVPPLFTLRVVTFSVLSAVNVAEPLMLRVPIFENDELAVVKSLNFRLAFPLIVS